MRTLTILALFTLATLNMKASAYSMTGADITYQWLHNNVYRVTLTYYRNCVGTSAPTAPVIAVHNACKNYTLSVTLKQIGSTKQCVPLCSSEKSNSTCNSGKQLGVSAYMYNGTIDLGDTCKDWVFSYTDCCRNSSVTNLTSPSTTGIYVEAHLNNTHITGYKDNSPVFKELATVYITDNDTASINFSAYDPDGDSLAYYLVTPHSTDHLSYVSYATGYYSNRPFNDTFRLFDSTTGIYRVYPKDTQATAVSVIVYEYRNGKRIGSITRDVEIIVGHSGNHLPRIKNFGGATSISACVTDSIHFTFSTDDVDYGQRVTVSIDSMPGLSYSTDTSAHPSIHIGYKPDTSNKTPGNSILYLHVSDNNCPINGTRTYAINLQINRCTNTYEIKPTVYDIKIMPTLVNGSSFRYINNTLHNISGIVIYDAVGRIVKNLRGEQTNTINVNALPNGAYILGFQLDNGYNVVKRIVIQR